MYRKEYESADNLKVFIKVLIASLRNILSDNYLLYEVKENQEIEISHLKENNTELK